MATASRYRLQPLRIPSRWRVVFNSFFEVDPAPDKMEYFNESTMLCLETEDLRGPEKYVRDADSGRLQCLPRGRVRYAIDLAFDREDDPEGHYVVVFYSVEWSKDQPPPKGGDLEDIGVFRSRSRVEIVDRIERFMEDVWRYSASQAADENDL